MGNRKATLLDFLDHEIPAGCHPEQSYLRTSMKKQIQNANLSMTATYSYSLALTLQEKKRFKSEFYDLSSSGLFEKFKLWIEVDSPKSKEIPNRKTFSTMMNSVGVKNIRSLIRQQKGER